MRDNRKIKVRVASGNEMATNDVKLDNNIEEVIETEEVTTTVEETKETEEVTTTVEEAKETEEVTTDDTKTEDNNVSVFVDEERTKDNMKLEENSEDKKNKSSFYLFQEDSNRLFVFGKDIWVGKKGYNASCNQNDNCCYDYRGNEKALTGITGFRKKDEFEIKRIIEDSFCLLELNHNEFFNIKFVFIFQSCHSC